jgi:hypothetical protein
VGVSSMRPPPTRTLNVRLSSWLLMSPDASSFGKLTVTLSPSLWTLAGGQVRAGALTGQGEDVQPALPNGRWVRLDARPKRTHARRTPEPFVGARGGARAHKDPDVGADHSSRVAAAATRLAAAQAAAARVDAVCRGRVPLNRPALQATPWCCRCKEDCPITTQDTDAVLLAQQSTLGQDRLNGVVVVYDDCLGVSRKTLPF